MDTPFGSTFEDDIKQVLTEVPTPIRAFFASGKVGTVAKNLMQKYQLHIDTGAIMERELILLLLGINTPSEFTQALAEEAQLDQQTVTGIVQDVNAQIFVSLREEMRKGPTEVKPPQVPAAPSAVPREEPVRVNASILPPLTTIIPANPQLPPRPEQMLTSVPRYVPPKKYFHLQNKIPTAPPPTPAPQPYAPREEGQTSLNPAKLLEDHEEPSPPLRAVETTAHIEFKKTAPSPVTSPKTMQGTAPAPAKPYSSDPYREPFDEK